MILVNKAKGPQEFSDADEQIVSGVFGSLAEQAVGGAIEQAGVVRLKKRMEQILESITAIVCNFNVKKELLATNKPLALAKLAGLEEGTSMNGMTYEALFRNDPTVLLALDGALFDGKSVEHFTTLLARPDGTSAYLSLSATSLQRSKDGIAVVMEDYTAEMRLKETLLRYMPPKLAELVIADGNVLGGHATVCSVVFIDIRGFTALADEITPQELVSTLNEHFDGIIEACIAHDGIVDKFIGDCIMCVFGLPFAGDNDAGNAVETMLDLQLFISRLSKSRREAGIRELKVGVGCNTGLMIAGNVGNEHRQEYTVIGGAVNVASRVESATKQLAVSSLVTETTIAAMGAVAANYVYREIDKVLLKGVAAPVRLYEIMGRVSEDKGDVAAKLASEYEAALAFYRQGDWAAASKSWSRLADQGDACSASMLARISNAAGPPADFNDVYLMTLK